MHLFIPYSISLYSQIVCFVYVFVLLLVPHYWAAIQPLHEQEDRQTDTPIYNPSMQNNAMQLCGQILRLLKFDFVFFFADFHRVNARAGGDREAFSIQIINK